MLQFSLVSARQTCETALIVLFPSVISLVPDSRFVRGSNKIYMGADSDLYDRCWTVLVVAAYGSLTNGTGYWQAVLQTHMSSMTLNTGGATCCKV